MAKITNTEVKDLGFTKEMYGKATDVLLDTMIDAIISNISAQLEGILSSAYDSAVSPIKEYVKQAEEALVAEEMLKRRIIRRLGNITGDSRGIDVKGEKNLQKEYRSEAERFVCLILGDDDFSFGVAETTHFDDTADVAGLEALQ